MSSARPRRLIDTHVPSRSRAFVAFRPRHHRSYPPNHIDTNFNTLQHHRPQFSPSFHTIYHQIPRMMLSSTYYTPPMPHYSAYTPPRSSPLSERTANTAPRIFDLSMSSPSEKKPIGSQRAFKVNPVMQTRDAATRRRRDMFFRRVQTGRDDKKWETRGEQVREITVTQINSV